MAREHRIRGSEARDFAMLERNLLSHLRLALILSLSFASLLLQARLPTPSDPGSAQTPRSRTGLAISWIELIAAVLAIAAGLWEYWQGMKKDGHLFVRSVRGLATRVQRAHVQADEHALARRDFPLAAQDRSPPVLVIVHSYDMCSSGVHVVRGRMRSVTSRR